MKKKFVFYLITFSIAFLLIDTVLLVSLKIINKKKTIFYDGSNISKAKIEFWLNNSFDEELGWDQPREDLNRLGSRKYKVYIEKPFYKIKTFGDSFTQGTGVENNETWQAFIEQLTGLDCLNFGVQGYGVDQAFLKYKRYKNVKSQYTVLAIHIENIARVVSVYRAFYTGNWAPPKPYYSLLNENIKLNKSPVSTREDVYKLLDNNFVEEIRAIDYWPHYYEEIRGSPRRLTWPATLVLVRYFKFFYKRSVYEIKRKIFPSYNLELQRSRYYHLYNESSTAFIILKGIINQFIELSHERGELPIILIFPSQHSIDLIRDYNKSLYWPLIKFLDENNFVFINFGNIFVSENYSNFYLSYDGHFSKEGNKRIASHLINFIEKLEQN